MPRDFHRSRRIEDQIQRILSDVLRTEVSDPRLAGLIITSVDVSRDLGVAKIYYTSLNREQDAESLAEAFTSATKFIRGKLARELTVRNVPELRFRHDDSLERAAKMERLIERAVERSPGDDEDEPA